MKVAFNTDVLVAALRGRTGASNALLCSLRQGQVEAVASLPMLLEYEAVLMRPEQRKVTGISAQDVSRRNPPAPKEHMMASTSNYALRLLTSLKAEAEKVAAAEGTTLNQFINVAVAEKLAVLRTAQYFKERAARADCEAFDRLLADAGDDLLRPGDEPV